MDLVITEAGLYAAGGERLTLLDAAAGAAQVQRLLRLRDLPRKSIN